MKLGISVKIDVNKIDKTRLFKGDKGTYLDLTTFIDTDQQGKYGDNGFISQSVTKEEREKDVKGNILGNVTVFFKGDGQKNDPSEHASGNRNQVNPTYEQAPQMSGDDFSDDVPFNRLGNEYLV